MIFIVAFVLSLAATLLQPLQQKNLDMEKMKDILTSAQISAEKDDIINSYHQYVTQEIVLNMNGEEVAIYKDGKFDKDNIRAFELDLKEQLFKIEKTGEGLLPLYMVEKEELKIYIIPLLGKGLWGPIWGTIALEDDFNTVAGVTFGHKSETPGLGAEISTNIFHAEFAGKKIFNEKGEFISITLVKGGVKSSRTILEENGVDAISGGTITSNGVSNMLKDCIKNYLPYFEKLRKDE